MAIHVTDLHQLRIPNADGPDKEQVDHSCTDGDVSVFFRDHERHLITEIEKADCVVGCVAWLTSKPILRAMTKLKGLSIIVQKEDFLRPDEEQLANLSDPNWEPKDDLFGLYVRLPGLQRFEGSAILADMSYNQEPWFEGVRCVGNHNRDKAPAFPRCHHKFVVFCRRNPAVTTQDAWTGEGRYWVPHAVWTGSFNFTWNATRSFENAVLIQRQSVVEAYFSEWGQIAALSEPLDWTSDWATPEWRIGT